MGEHVPKREQDLRVPNLPRALLDSCNCLASQRHARPPCGESSIGGSSAGVGAKVGCGSAVSARRGRLRCCSSRGSDVGSSGGSVSRDGHYILDAAIEAALEPALALVFEAVVESAEAAAVNAALTAAVMVMEREEEGKEERDVDTYTTTDAQVPPKYRAHGALAAARRRP